ncbi:MAG: uroporphyrinogen decarboxylase [Terriglobia bacterium]
MAETARTNASFEGLTVAAFESRRATEIATLISRFEGVPRVAPSMREAPLEDNSAALEFGEKLLAGFLDMVILMTGAGVTLLIEALESRHARRALIEAFSAVAVVARGSKTVRALENFGIPIKVKAPEPNTWRELLQALDSHYGQYGAAGLAHIRIALQEYGEPNGRLVDELRRRGAKQVLCVPVYRWALPEDTAPLDAALGEIISGRARIVLFTNAVQVNHLAQFAAQRKAKLLEALRHSVVCSVGPTCSEAIIAHGLTVDFESESHKMGAFIHEAAGRAPALLRKKDQQRSASPPVTVTTPVLSSPEGAKPAWPKWYQSRFMKACRLEPVDATPVWLMRQAGRYMQSYRDLRSRVPFLELCKSPDLAAEVTVSAAEQIGADAAILFADLLLVAEPMGFKLNYDKPGGPWVSPKLQTTGSIDALLKAEPAAGALSYVFDAVRRARASLRPATPLIGFVGAPFTLASYLIEGGPSKGFRHTKALMLGDSGAWCALMNYLARTLAACINGQIEAGAQAMQIFDSWVGCLSPGDYREFVLPHMQSLFRSLMPGVPVIHFGTGTGSLLELMREAGGSIIGLDFRVELDEAWSRLGPGVGVQGNLEPAVLYADLACIRKRTVRILRQAGGRPGHIFNLGHGVLPETPEQNVADLIKIVHEESARLKEEKQSG